MRFLRSFPMRGMGLADVTVGVALTLIIFLSIFGVLRASLLLSALTKAKSSAIALANERVEHVRALAYDDVGTLGGIPAGLIEAEEDATVNDVPFGVHTFVQYVDDAADGLGASDENGVPADYKRVRVAVSYAISGVGKEVSLVTNVAPSGIETTEGGGTLRIDVANETGVPVAGATVHIENTDTNPDIDVITFTNTDGLVYLPGAPPATGYVITVTKAGYDSESTYDQTEANPNPTPGHLTVAEGETTTGTFAIDRTGSLTIFASSLETEEASSTPLSGVSITLVGNKTIGSTALGAPIYKTIEAQETNAEGAAGFVLETDVYALSVEGYDVASSCLPAPYTFPPDGYITPELTLVPETPNWLLVFVRDGAGALVSGATVELSRGAFSETVLTDSCGNAYFGGFGTAHDDYALTISKTGYATTGFGGVSVSGQSFYDATFE